VLIAEDPWTKQKDHDAAAVNLDIIWSAGENLVVALTLGVPTVPKGEVNWGDFSI
jgi:hypothetical protein